MIRSGSATHYTDWSESFDHGQVNLILNSSTALGEESKPSFHDARIKAYEIHGWICLVAWFPLGYTLIATKRYFKTRWYLMHHSHNVLGLIVTALTIGTCIQVYAYADWKQQFGPHGILGAIALLVTLFVGITGIITSAMMEWYTGDKPWAERDKVFNVARIHRWSSYFMLLLGNGVCSGGIATYFSLIDYGLWGTFGVLTSIFFLILLGLHEYCMRRYNRKNFKLIEGQELQELIESRELRSYTPQEIEHAVQNGDSLVICDNLVLRTSGYEKIHPGGKFTIVKNFGRDIAKFYYGNYSLTNGPLTKPYTHSGQANLILQSMIIGIIDD